MKRIIATVLFIIGFILLIFPFVLRIISFNFQSKVVYEYKNSIETSDKKELEDRQKEANEYNERLSNTKPVVTIGNEIETRSESASTFSFLKSGNVIGTIIIPKISLNLPIYDGTDDDNLEKGAVHIKETSYPTGQTSTHSIIVGHSGLTQAKIFDDVDKLEIGDYFQVEYLGDTYNYEIIERKVVLPKETDSLRIRDNETLLSLVTCTPKGINSHRLIVTAKKIDNIPEDKIVEQKVKMDYTNIIIVIGLTIVFILGLIIINIKLKKDKKSQ